MQFMIFDAPLRLEKKILLVPKAPKNGNTFSVRLFLDLTYSQLLAAATSHARRTMIILDSSEAFPEFFSKNLPISGCNDEFTG